MKSQKFIVGFIREISRHGNGDLAFASNGKSHSLNLTIYVSRRT